MDGIFEADLLNTVLKTIAMLFIVLGLLVLVLYFVKRFLLLKQKSKGTLPIKVLSSLHLSQKERIEIIEVSGEKIVLGITPGSISFLTKINCSGGDNRAINENGKYRDIME